MKILAIETSSECGSIALLQGGDILSKRLPGSGSKHSEALLPFVRQLLSEADIPLRALDAIAFGRGPGAFTGVRLACGVAQGLALGADLPVAAIGSLQALAWSFVDRAQQFYCAMDARMSEVYAACYRFDGEALLPVGEIVCTPPAEVPVPDGTGWLGIGNAFTAYAPVLKERLAGHVTVLDEQAVPVAAAVAALAARDRASWQDPALAAPDYVRNRVALTVAERLAQGGRA